MKPMRIILFFCCTLLTRGISATSATLYVVPYTISVNATGATDCKLLLYKQTAQANWNAFSYQGDTNTSIVPLAPFEAIALATAQRYCSLPPKISSYDASEYFNAQKKISPPAARVTVVPVPYRDDVVIPGKLEWFSFNTIASGTDPSIEKDFIAALAEPNRPDNAPLGQTLFSTSIGYLPYDTSSTPGVFLLEQQDNSIAYIKTLNVLNGSNILERLTASDIPDVKDALGPVDQNNITTYWASEPGQDVLLVSFPVNAAIKALIETKLHMRSKKAALVTAQELYNWACQQDPKKTIKTTDQQEVPPRFEHDFIGLKTAQGKNFISKVDPTIKTIVDAQPLTASNIPAPPLTKAPQEEHQTSANQTNPAIDKPASNNIQATALEQPETLDRSLNALASALKKLHEQLSTMQPPS